MSLDVVLQIARLVLLIELFRSFRVMIKRYVNYKMNKLEKVLKEIDREMERRDKK